MSFRGSVFGLALLAAGVVHAQSAGVVSLQANQSSGTGSVTPVLTWSTNPAAVGCTAGGGWSGAKAASGSQTLPAISATTNYTLTCSWGGDRARLSWVAPATNTDGSVINNLTGFKVVYGTSATALNQSLLINDVTVRTTTVTALTPGTWFFAIRAVNALQAESGNSNVAQLTVAPATASGNTTITVTATPPPTTPPPTTPPPTPPVTTLKTNGAHVYDVVTSNGTYRRGNLVGVISIGKPCDGSFTTGSSHYKVSRSEVRFFRSSRSQTVVASCASS